MSTRAVVEERAVRLYGTLGRLWHWVQAGCIGLLLLSGIEVHSPSVVRILGFQRAVSAHVVLGFVLVSNALFGLLYHLLTGEIRQYLPGRYQVLSRVAAQARYYLKGIFRREPHPFQRTPERRLNPLQQLTYLAVLNVLLPLQVVTGLLMWAAQRWPGFAPVGELPVLAAVHSLVSWMFGAFLIGHLYLITTGPTPLAYLRTMISGWEHPAETSAQEQEYERTAA